LKIVVSNPSVPPHVKQTVMAYQEASYLDHFYTSFFEHPKNVFSSALKKIKSLEKEINRRSFHELPIDKFVSRPIPELLRSIASRKLPPIAADRIWEWSELGFDNWVSKNLHQNIDAVHTYEHAALSTLKKAKELNILGIYEQPSQHHAFFDTIVKRQTALYPELKTEAANLLVNDKAIKRNARRDEELALASLIICNSTFTKRTLIAGGIDPQKIAVIPLSFPPVIQHKKTVSGKKPMVFIHAGNQSLRKGSHLLYKAWRNCNFPADEAELWLVGKMQLPQHLRDDLPGKVIIKENIPHDELMALYQQADVFVLPTLADGFGMVVTEAMSQGVPVIASENCCGPDVIEHGKDGWIIPAGDIEQLTIQMKWCIANPQQVAACGNEAIQKAIDWQWPKYREKLAEIVFNKWQQFEQEKLSV
jgi:glycosyltransferase involved in cell wall biosynthesis